jgi:hypothetical protein
MKWTSCFFEKVGSSQLSVLVLMNHREHRLMTFDASQIPIPLIVLLGCERYCRSTGTQGQNRSRVQYRESVYCEKSRPAGMLMLRVQPTKGELST